MLKTFFYEQFFSGPMLDSHVPLNGKTVIVTGSNQGLGYDCALQLAKLSASLVILAVRDTAGGEEAAIKIREQTGAKVEVWKLDLQSFDSVKAFAGRCQELKRLDILVENAGINTPSWKSTGDGWESAFQTNVLSTGLLAVLLLPLLVKTAEKYPDKEFRPHLTIVGSEAHGFAGYAERKVPGPVLNTLNQREHFVSMDRYNVTKLFNLFIARKLSALPRAKPIVVNVVNPGLCSSNIGREFPRIIVWLARYLARTTEEGAKNLTWAAVYDTPPGSYVSCCGPKPASAWSTSREGLEEETRAWKELVTLWKTVSPEVQQTIE